MSANINTIWTDELVKDLYRIGFDPVYTDNGNGTWTVAMNFWFWAKTTYSDVKNTFYYKFDSDREKTHGALNISIKTKGDWSPDNQQLCATWRKTYDNSVTDYKFQVRFTGINEGGNGTYSYNFSRKSGIPTYLKVSDTEWKTVQTYQKQYEWGKVTTYIKEGEWEK